MYKLEVRAESAPWYNGIEFLVMQSRGRTRAVGVEVIMVERGPESEGTKIEPTFTLERKEAQQLMDDLWHAGLRPTEGHGSVGQLAAVQYHLEDMRTLVFNNLKGETK